MYYQYLGNDMGKMHLIMAVWGKPYIDQFLKISLPSQLAPGNLPSLKNDPRFTYKIYTTLEDGIYLSQQKIFKKLTKLISTKIISVEKIQSDDKFSPLMDFHNKAIQEADAENAALIFLSPDFVFADGTLSKLIELWAAGYRAVMVLTLRLIEETAKVELINEYYDKKNQTLTVAPGNLVQTCLKHLHPIEKTYFWGDRFSSFPIHAYWPVHNAGLAARCYYLHPLMVNPLVKHVLPNITIDADYIDLACPNRSLIHIVQDSDELCCFELTSAATHDTNAPKPAAPAKVINYAHWANVHANPVFNSLLHHMYFQVPIRIHSGPITKEWLKVENRARRVAWCVRLWTFFFRRHGNITNALDFFLATKFKKPLSIGGLFQNINSPGVQRLWNGYKINFFDIISKVGWGNAEQNDLGQKWRWIDSKGYSSISIRLESKKSYILKSLIHTALGDSLYKLEVLINGQPVAQQQIISQGEKIWHRCIIPKQEDLEIIELTFSVNQDKTEDRLALSVAILKQTLYDPRALYVCFRKIFGNKVKAILGFPKT